MTIRWKRPDDGYVESHDGAWRITPLYCGCTRPQAYVLADNGRRKGGEFQTQRAAKEHAEELTADRPVKVVVKPRLTPCAWVRCLICKPMAPCYRCRNGWWPSCPQHLLMLTMYDDGKRGLCLAGHPHDAKQFSVGASPKRAS